jgi:glycosyl hydrolase family 39 (putative alpha-L-iduronidase)
MILGNRALRVSIVSVLCGATFAWTMSSTGAVANATIDVDIRKVNLIGSPDVFGAGTHGISNINRYRQHRLSGINNSRTDAWLQGVLPATTIEEYRSNARLRDPASWRWKELDSRISALYESGFRIVLVVGYCPQWLSYSNTAFGVPRDWAIWQDIVGKVYSRYKDKIDVIEVWNEPTMPEFLVLDNSPYTDKKEAYLEIYKNTAQAVRNTAGGARVKLGGPSLNEPKPEFDDWVRLLLQDDDARKNLDFLSYHRYGQYNVTDEFVAHFRRMAAPYGKPDIPVLITEWNFTARHNQDPMNNEATEAIPYVAYRLIQQLNAGLSAGQFYNMSDDIEKGDKRLHFRTMDAEGNLYPKMRSFVLLSNQLGLGQGSSLIADAPFTEVATALGAVNAAGQPVAAAVNNGYSPAEASITFHGLAMTGDEEVEVFKASAMDDPILPAQTVKAPVRDGRLSLTVTIPPQSVIGLRLRASQATLYKAETAGLTGVKAESDAVASARQAVVGRENAAVTVKASEAGRYIGLRYALATAATLSVYRNGSRASDIFLERTMAAGASVNTYETRIIALDVSQNDSITVKCHANDCGGMHIDSVLVYR